MFDAPGPTSGALRSCRVRESGLAGFSGFRVYRVQVESLRFACVCVFTHAACSKGICVCVCLCVCVCVCVGGLWTGTYLQPLLLDIMVSCTHLHKHLYTYLYIHTRLYTH